MAARSFSALRTASSMAEMLRGVWAAPSQSASLRAAKMDADSSSAYLRWSSMAFFLGGRESLWRKRAS